MITLTQFDKYKLEGFVYLSREMYNDSLESFEKALKIKEDGHIYFQMAYDYVYLKDYKKAQECALKAINNGYDAYQLYDKIAVGNLQDIYTSIKVLKEGIEKHYSSACLSMAMHHSFNNILPDMISPWEAAKYLELAYEYAKPEEKALVTYSIYHSYKSIAGAKSSAFLEANFKEDRAAKYLKLFAEFGGVPQRVPLFNVSLFNELDEKDDADLINLLFKNFDGDSKLIFAMLLLEDEMKINDTISVENNSFAFLTVLDGVLKDNNGSCCLLMSLCFGSDFEGSQDDENVIKDLLKTAKKNRVLFPNRFKPMVREMMGHLNDKYSVAKEYFISKI